MDETVLFVYGALLRGEAHHSLIARARPLGDAATAPAFDLVDLGEFPGIVAGFGSVRGELYAVDGGTLEALDRFEGHPVLFRREPVPMLAGGEAQTYVWARPRPDAWRLILSRDWRRRQ